jgi:hypothetical protein
LPDSVTTANPLTICFRFAPAKIGDYQIADTIRVGAQKKVITLLGSAGFDSVTFSPRRMDFGDVLLDSVKSLSLAIKNRGTFPASLITLSQPRPDYEPISGNQTIGGSPLIDMITFAPKHLGLDTSMIIFQWEDHLDTIFLSARGIQPGLQFPSSIIDFGQIRVGQHLDISDSVTNTLAVPIIVSSVSVGGKFHASPTGSTLINPLEWKKYTITYSPDAETSDTSTLILQTRDNGIATIPVRGEGVEAHLLVDTSTIDFLSVGLQQTKKQDLKISNTGGYPLAITNVAHGIKETEFDTATGGVFLIQPHDSTTYIISFTPQRAVRYLDSLRIDVDAPEKSAIIPLIGRGVFAPLGIPAVTYSIPNIQAKVGDIVAIPISIGGKDLSLFNLNSFYVDITYDPTVVYFDSIVITDATLSFGFKDTFARLSHDSVIHITGSGKEIIPSPGILFILQAEALLGPEDSTRISIQSSDPQNTGSLLSSSGEFVVTDCGNYRAQIVFKGNYSVSDIKPNPVSSVARIDYEIGLPGVVHLDLYDALGRLAKTIVDEDQTQGKHSVSFSTDGMPSGEYIYLLRSLEYKARGSLIIAK